MAGINVPKITVQKVTFIIPNAGTYGCLRFCSFKYQTYPRTILKKDAVFVMHRLCTHIHTTQINPRFRLFLLHCHESARRTFD
jgi:hypothetical protein